MVASGIITQLKTINPAAAQQMQATMNTMSTGMQQIGATAQTALRIIGLGAAGAMSIISGFGTPTPVIKHARGGCIAGSPMGDHIPVMAANGALLGIADGGELVVNRHTEADVNSLLGMFGTSLGGMVASESRPHFATGGSLSLPNMGGSGLLGPVAQAALMSGAYQSGTTAGAYMVGFNKANAASAPATSGGSGAGIGGVTFPGGGGAAAASGWISEAIAITGVTPAASWHSMLMRQASRESSYNPNSINRWDINAQHGNPSEGMLQVTGSNFRQYGPKGGNILNPVDNTVASIHYIEAAYGGMAGGLAHMIANGGAAYRLGGRLPGFAKGGRIKAPERVTLTTLRHQELLIRRQLAVARKGHGTGKHKVVNHALVNTPTSELQDVQDEIFSIQHASSEASDPATQWSNIQTIQGYGTDTATLAMTVASGGAPSQAGTLGVAISRARAGITQDTSFASSLQRQIKSATKTHNTALANILKDQLKQVQDAITQSKTTVAQDMYQQAMAVFQQRQQTQQTAESTATSSTTQYQNLAHAAGTDIAGIQLHAQLFQGGQLTSGDLATARQYTQGLNTGIAGQIASYQTELGSDRSMLGTLKPGSTDYNALQQTINGLIDTITGLGGQMTDNTNQMTQLTQATFNSAAAMNNLAGGSVGFSYQGQTFAIGQTSDITSGMGY